MQPIKVKANPWGDIIEGLWVDCDGDCAIVVMGKAVLTIPYDALEVLPDEDPPFTTELEALIQQPAPRLRKRRSKRKSSPRGPRPGQWTPEKQE